MNPPPNFHEIRASSYEKTTTDRTPEVAVPVDVEALIARFSDVYGPYPPEADRIFHAINRHAYGVSRSKAPAGFFILAGPSGSGKTFFAQTIGKALHQREANAYLTINGADYADETDIRKLIGSPPGYMGHRETPPVLSAGALSVVRSSHSNLAVVIFDEAELLDTRVSRLFRSILDEENGAITLGDNTNLEFRNTLIFATTNIGTSTADETTDLGLMSTKAKKIGGVRSSSHLERQLVKKFGTAEFNRMRQLGGVITFPELSASQIRAIIRRRVNLSVGDFNRSPVLKARATGVLIKPSWITEFMAKYDLTKGVREGLNGIMLEVTDPLLNALRSSPELENYVPRFVTLGEVEITKG